VNEYDTAYWQGYDSTTERPNNDQTLRENPYPPDSPLAREFELGAKDGMRDN
jgi:hypothetical protein